MSYVSLFFVRAVIAVTNSVLFFLFGRLVSQFYTALNRRSLMVALCNITTAMVCFPLIFSWISLFGSNRISRLLNSLYWQDGRSFLEKALRTCDDLVANTSLPLLPSVTYTLREVREEVTATPTSYISEKLSPLYAVMVGEGSTRVPYFFVEPLVMEREYVNS
ncbi:MULTISPECIES: hypothetical protein [Candidatus Ichthyocystis]|uniref:Putative membrane protein n=1 Tax=Candidatus Ichthyocystis hellenicum TaxID=1561003 RepID=A0A0S4M4J6_9BURK|nr:MULTISPECIES: hypothetical protein [Ichthyocystis]CUT17197.1 putative membrane protein [Candidatus Ichthyocystis hellenicum]